jgi:tRNA A37 threonylcarbamoyladenosine biosynthesis protein TsaE
MMKVHYDFYRVNFINDQVGFEPMFPEPSRIVGWSSGHGEREVKAMILHK